MSGRSQPSPSLRRSRKRRNGSTGLPIKIGSSLEERAAAPKIRRSEPIVQSPGSSNSAVFNSSNESAAEGSGSELVWALRQSRLQSQLKEQSSINTRQGITIRSLTDLVSYRR